MQPVQRRALCIRTAGCYGAGQSGNGGQGADRGRGSRPVPSPHPHPPPPHRRELPSPERFVVLAAPRGSRAVNTCVFRRLSEGAVIVWRRSGPTLHGRVDVELTPLIDARQRGVFRRFEVNQANRFLKPRFWFFSPGKQWRGRISLCVCLKHHISLLNSIVTFYSNQLLL